MDCTPLVRAFEKVGLDLKLTGPLASSRFLRGGNDIFMMDVRPPPRNEHFVLYPGAESNRVLKLGEDKSLQQLVLMVHEPRRSFDTLAPRRSVLPGAQIISKPDEKDRVWVRNWTPEDKRHFLCGMDESHYFMCRLPRGVSSVKDAHAVLKPQAATSANGKVIRQGEWFFVEPNRGSVEAMEYALKNGTTWLDKKIPIAVAFTTNRRSNRQLRGNPHIVDEAVNFKGRVFVRGQVRHVDHMTVEFYAWREVLRNTEPNPEQVVAGMTWAD